MIDRSKPPAFHQIQKVSLSEPDYFSVADVPFYVFNFGSQPVIKCELIFNAGKYHEKIPGQAYFSLKMLTEGSSSLSASEIAQALDYNGAFLDLKAGSDFSAVSLYCLEKHFNAILPVLSQIICSPVFPSAQLEKLKGIKQQNLRIQNQKNNYVASKLLLNAIFGHSHPYGKNLEEQYINKINDDLVKKYYADFLVKNFHSIILSGSIGAQKIDQIGEALGGVLERRNTKRKLFPIRPGQKKQVISKDSSVQCTIKMGRRVPGRTDDVYPELVVLNELLGGYFGSRLMKNIREEKGLTYGIYSSLNPLVQDAYMVISAEVKKEQADSAIDEILKEMKKLRTKLAGEAELSTVRNYMMGSFLSEISSPFDLADKYKAVLLHHMDFSYYHRFFRILKRISPERIRELAAEYLVPKEFSFVIVG